MSLQVLGILGQNPPLVRAEPVHGRGSPVQSIQLLQVFLNPSEIPALIGGQQSP